MSCKPDIETTSRMYARYQCGLSLEEVADEFGVTRQSVYDRLKRQGLKLRGKVFQPAILFNGQKFTRVNSGGAVGYYRKTDGDRELLHRAVWKTHFGPIPSGFDVHHKTTDLATTDVRLLVCMPKPEHGRLESTGINQFTPPEVRVRIVADHRARKAAA